MKNDILNKIDEVSELLSIFIELKEKGKFQDAIKKIDDTLLKYFNIESSSFNTISEDLLIDFLKKNKGLTSEQLSSLVEILHEKGNILLKQNNLKVSKSVLKNTLKLYYFLNEEQDFFSFKNMNKIVLLNEKLAKINLKIQS
ncbi:MAG: hypothetical protein PF487_15065 [Bacteroidales bacterium]|jgi:hypothetical protein|nr:hypothetical protein [Bacteroidales bacterium]